MEKSDFLEENDSFNDGIVSNETERSLDEQIEVWRHTNLKLNGPGTIEFINKIQEKIGFLFPEDFIKFYMKVNGFNDWDMTEEMFCIWPLERISEEFEINANSNFIPFCDYQINSHRIGYLKDEPGVYKEYYDSNFYRVADSFEQTVQLIVSNSGLLY